MADFVAETRDDIRNAIAETLKQCEDDGMTFPVILCAVSPNGSIFANRIDGLGGSEVLVQHFEPEGFRVPMTIMVVDQNNIAARLTIDHGGKVSRH
jgi:hypothetical protein